MARKGGLFGMSKKYPHLSRGEVARVSVKGALGFGAGNGWGGKFTMLRTNRKARKHSRAVKKWNKKGAFPSWPK